MSGVPIDVITVPYDDGRRNWRMGAGPLAFIEGGIPFDTLREWGHDVRIDIVETDVSGPLESAIALAAGIAGCVRAARAAGRVPIVLAGNCVATLGAVAGLDVDAPGVVWFDAHGDFNTPDTSTSGFLDGMSCAMLLGWCHGEALAAVPGFRPVEAQRVLSIGAHDFDPGERERAESRGVHVLPPELAADEARLARALDTQMSVTDAVWLHIDLDVIDPREYGPANRFAVPGGLCFHDVIRAVQEVVARSRVLGLTLSAWDPAVDAKGMMRAAVLPLIAEALAGTSARR